MTSPSTTLEITSSGSLIRVKGKRSTKGWNILEVTGAKSTPLAHIKGKDKAIQYALDACEPGTTATYLVRPA